MHTPDSRIIWSRRRLIKSAGLQLLAASALILASRGLVMAEEPDPMRIVVCPDDEYGHRYNPAVGDPENGIPAGTSFDDLPEDWHCPVCGTHIGVW